MLYNPIPIIITLAGAYILIKLRGFFILHPIRSMKDAIAVLGRRENFRSFTLALSGTLGVGNVLGVAVGIILGGRGSLAWLLVSSVFSAALKYAEVTLSEDSRDGRRGGMYYSVRSSFLRLGGILSTVYAFACLLLGLVMGAALQSHSVTSVFGELFDTPPALPSILLAFAVLLAIVGGGRLISKITEIAIPASTIVYIILTFAVIFTHLDRLGDVIISVMRSAFEPRACAGGIVGFLFSSPVREGYSRGVLSNEAGAGTSTIAHSTGADVRSTTRGMLGVLEVVFDTVILCTLTGLAILLAVPSPEDYTSGALLVLDALKCAFGGISGHLLLFSIAIFAYSTILSWYYYSAECIRQLFGRVCHLTFAPLYLSFVLLGGFISEVILVSLSDYLLLVLVGITVPTLIKNSDRLVCLSEKSGLLKIK